MNRKAIFTYAILPTLLIGGAATFHRSRRNAELDRQKVTKDAALITVSLASVETRPFHGTLNFTGTLLAVDRAEIRAGGPGPGAGRGSPVASLRWPGAKAIA